MKAVGIKIVNGMWRLRTGRGFNRGEEKVLEWMYKRGNIRMIAEMGRRVRDDD